MVVLAKKKRVNENSKKEGDMIKYGYEKDDRIDFIGFSVDVFWRWCGDESGGVGGLWW